VAFTPDGKIAIACGCGKSGGLACSRGEIIHWSVMASRLWGPPVPTHTGEPVRLAVSSTGTHLASASTPPNILGGDARILLWDLRTETWIEKACDIANRGFMESGAEVYLSDL
jgi:hypothetical protein